MKLKYVKMIGLLLTVFCIGTIVNGQDENVSERFSAQLKNNAVPGWQYTKTEAARTPITINGENNKEGFAAQIRKGTAPGMRFLPTTAGNTSARMTQKKSSTQTAQLPSEQSRDTATVPRIKVIPIPTQEELKEKK